MSLVGTTVLFDLDGTLTDSYVGFERSLRFAVESLGMIVPSGLRRFLGPPLTETFRTLGMDDAQTADALRLYRERYGVIGYLENEVYPGIAALLPELVAGGAVLGVATSKPERTAIRILEHFDLARHFGFIGGATLDGARSHKHEVIAHTTAGLGHPSPESIVMIGDRRYDVQGAARFGIPTIGVLWGYGDPDELTEAGAAAVVADTTELFAAIESRRC